MPEEYAEWLDRIKRKREGKEVPKKEKEKEEKLDRPLTKEEAREAFRKLLREKGMSSSWTQEQALQETRDDPRWKLLKMGEKKQVFQGLMAELRREEREEKRKKELKAEEDFIQLLFDCKEIKKHTTFREAMTLISTDQRFMLIVGDRERERLYNEFIDQRSRKERDESRKRRREGMENFRQFLESNKSVTVDTQWRLFKEQVADHPSFKDIDKLDSLSVFMDYIKDLESKDIEKLKEEKLDRRNKSRKCREGFRQLLEEYWVARKINVKTRWKEFKPVIRNDPRFIGLLDDDVEGGNSSTPAELFYDLIEDLEERYHKEKKRIKEILKENQVLINQQISYEAFLESINKHEYYKSLDETNLRFIYTDLQDKALRVEEKTKKKSKKKFLSLLKMMRITRTSTWEQIKANLPTSENIPFNDKEQKDLFDEHIKKRAQEDDFDSSSDEEEGAIHERRRSHKKERRHSSRSSVSRKKRDSDRRKDSEESDDNDEDSKHKKRRYL